MEAFIHYSGGSLVIDFTSKTPNHKNVGVSINNDRCEVKAAKFQYDKTYDVNINAGVKDKAFDLSILSKIYIKHINLDIYDISEYDVYYEEERWGFLWLRKRKKNFLQTEKIKLLETKSITYVANNYIVIK
jgi:hypothetical protein